MQYTEPKEYLHNIFSSMGGPAAHFHCVNPPQILRYIFSYMRVKKEKVMQLGLNIGMLCN